MSNARFGNGRVADSSRLTGRLLAYTNDANLDLAVEQTMHHSGSGLVLRSKSPTNLRFLRDYPQPALLDTGSWTTAVAQPDRPLALDDLFADLELWAGLYLNLGFSAVLTPSLLVRTGDWASLDAVLTAIRAAPDDRIIPLVAVDAEMLAEPYLVPFIRALAAGSHRPPALVLASTQRPMEKRGRVSGLRQLLRAVPGTLLLATEPIVATDALVAGAGSAAVGITGGLRKPRTPGSTGGPAWAKDWLPGLFLRELWEHRSPSVYADWYVRSKSPRCQRCGGRSLDGFGQGDQKAVLAHNVHEWLGVRDHVMAQPEEIRQTVLARERLEAYDRHLQLRPWAKPAQDVDPVLRQLVALDRPGGGATAAVLQR